MNVLLVEDEPTMRRLVKLMLQRHGVNVFDVDSGASALALSNNHSVDVVVTDVVMDGMDGTALARSLAQRRPDLPILFISGCPFNLQEYRSAHGRCSFLPKPFEAIDLLNAITELTR